MSTTPTPAFDLGKTYVRLEDDKGTTRLEVDERFWADIMAGSRHDLDHGWLVGVFPYTDDWRTAEMHPDGDEIVYVLAGEIELVLLERGTDRHIALHAGQGCIVPRGTWHTAKVRAAGRALHVTPNAGTQHRPLAADT
jgi:mannose-6-phosphate isomerase-like protein (cupin superfamily)